LKLSRRPFGLLSACALCIALAASSGAQDKKKEQKPEPPLPVRLSALVLDPQDRLVGDLRQEDFQILEDGVPQKISFFEKQEGPHAFGLIIDSSGSLRRDINGVIGFGKMMVTGTGADSEAFVVRFVASDNIKIIQDVTSDKAALTDALDSMFIEAGQTAVNDAVYLSAERIAKLRQGRSAPRRYSLILITDGEDRASYYKKSQVFEKLRAVGVRVFVVGFVGADYSKTSPEKAREYMNRLAFESGGSAYFVRKGSDLPQTARQVLAEMSANYVLGYDSTNPKRDGSARKIQLTVSGGAGGERRKILTADGYVAPKK
jgi:Ca-activated chloride channel family protein